MTAVRVIISGRVQGVGYRAWTAGSARALKLSGWVRNRKEGTVEAVFSGDDMAVHAMLEACKLGPASSRVDKIETFTHSEEVAAGFVAKETV